MPHHICLADIGFGRTAIVIFGPNGFSFMLGEGGGWGNYLYVT